jgi:uncharacterized protein
MTAVFLDTSALAKRYVVETGSPWVTSLTDPGSGNSSWISAVTPIELLAGLYRRARIGTITLTEAQQSEQHFRHELATHYQLVDLNPVILQEAMRLVAVHPLRAYDALQLATVLDLRAQRALHGVTDPVFVSADHSLNTAAAAEGLAVENPNQHP